jgi:hypothetical protein
MHLFSCLFFCRALEEFFLGFLLNFLSFFPLLPLALKTVVSVYSLCDQMIPSYILFPLWFFCKYIMMEKRGGQDFAARVNYIGGGLDTKLTAEWIPYRQCDRWRIQPIPWRNIRNADTKDLLAMYRVITCDSVCPPLLDPVILEYITSLPIYTRSLHLDAPNPSPVAAVSPILVS